MSGEHKPLDPRLMALRGRIGGHATHARYDPRATTAKARATFMASFEKAVDPDRVLAPEERERRAKQLRRAHFARMAYRSAVVRRKRRSAADGGADRRPSDER